MLPLLKKLSGRALRLWKRCKIWQCSQQASEKKAERSNYYYNRYNREAAESAIKNEYEAWNQKGNRLLLNRRYEEAIAAFERALQLKPNCSYAWQLRGDALRQTKRYAEALASYDKAIEFSATPISRYQALNALGALLLELENYEDALAAYDNALTICPNGMAAPHILEMKGIALSKLKRYDEAAVLFDTAYAKAVEVCAKTL